MPRQLREIVAEAQAAVGQFHSIRDLAVAATIGVFEDDAELELVTTYVFNVAAAALVRRGGREFAAKALAPYLTRQPFPTARRVLIAAAEEADDALEQMGVSFEDFTL